HTAYNHKYIPTRRSSDLSPDRNMNNDQGPKMIIEPIIGIKSMTQIRSDMIKATSGVIRNRPNKETINIIILRRNCALMKPSRKSVSRMYLKENFSAVSFV